MCLSVNLERSAAAVTLSEVVVNTETKSLIAACICGIAVTKVSSHHPGQMIDLSGKVRKTEVTFCYSREMAESQNNINNHPVCAHHPFPSNIQNY